MTAPDLRPYQRDVIAEFRGTVEAGRKRIMAVAPTGAGKTVIAAAIVRDSIEKGQRVLFFSHRREITKQTHVKLFAQGIDAGIVQAGFEPRPHVPVQVASIQTLTARAIRGSSIELPHADLVIVDEAHHTPAETYRKVLAKYPDAVVLGLTATPCRKDGRGLGNIFEVMIECPQVAELVELGFLVGTNVYAPANRIDLSGIRTQAGDYVENQLAARMNTDKLVGDVITHWHRHASDRKTVIFATDVAHSLHLRDEFRKSGVLAEHIDGNTPIDERDATLSKLTRGEIQIVTNCQVLTEGVDIPDISCIVLARPTKSMGLFRQMVGRGLRPAPGKTDCMLLDHAGAVFEHGFVDEPITWMLDTDKRAVNKKHAARKDSYASRLCDCPKCGALRTAGEKCRSCGFLPQRRPERREFIEGDLGHVERNRAATGPHYSERDKQYWHAALSFIAHERARARAFNVKGWVYYKYLERFGHRPPWNAPQPVPPSAEIRAWVRSRDIAYAKAMQKRGAA